MRVLSIGLLKGGGPEQPDSRMPARTSIDTTAQYLVLTASTSSTNPMGAAGQIRIHCAQ